MKLSLFLRDLQGRPIIPHESPLPAAFPRHATPYAGQFDEDISRALSARPKLAERGLLTALNIYEQAVTDAGLLLIAAPADFFAALADYRAALSLDPLTLAG